MDLVKADAAEFAEAIEQGRHDVILKANVDGVTVRGLYHEDGEIRVLLELSPTRLADITFNRPIFVRNAIFGVLGLIGRNRLKGCLYDDRAVTYCFRRLES